MKWQLLNLNLANFMALLSDEALLYFEEALEKYEIVKSPFSIELNSFVSIQCLVEDNMAYILSFSYGRYANINTGRTQREIDFIALLENKYLEANSYIELSPKIRNKFKKYLHF